MSHLKAALSCTLAAAAIAACAPLGDPTRPAATATAEPEQRRSARLPGLSSKIFREASGAARVSGAASGPAGMVGGNIVANNSAAIVANNTQRYGLTQLGYREEPIANAIVYLTDPEERFFAKDREPIAATTDDLGRYAIPDGVSTDQVVIVNVILSENRREVGFAFTRAGDNRVDVSLATTYVTEFLRSRAAAAGKKMADYDLSKLPQLTALTAQALKTGELGVPDLSIGKIGDMNHAYALAVGLNRQGLGDAWAALLGKRVVAMTTIAGNGDYGTGGDGGPATLAEFQKPIGLARDAAGNLYVIDEGAHVVRRIAPDGKVTLFAGTGRPTFEGDGGPATAASLNWPRAGVVRGDALYVADTLNQRIRRIDLGTGTISTIAGAPEVVNGVPLNDFAGDGGPATAARLAGVRGLALGADGTLFFADSWDTGGKSWHHIRRIAPDGKIDTIAGVDGQHGFNGDGKPGRETRVNFVNQLVVDGRGDVYFADTRNHRVRRWEAATGIVTTIAGTGKDGRAGDGGPATAAELSSPYGLALDERAGKRTLFISERGARRIRAIGPDGVIRTVAGGGERTSDGEATGMALNEPIELLLEPNGNLLVADSRGAKIRRLWLEWGF